ncbi:MAG: hypothetical protein QXI58_03395 [Candidatus Micrarchaeia archaeon]
MVFYFLIGESTLKSKLIYFRRYSFLPLTFLIFSLLPIRFNEIKNFLNISFKIFYVSFLFGIIEYISPIELWEQFFNISQFWKETGVDPWADIPLAESGRFFSYDLYFLLGWKLRRAISIFLDPTLFSAFLYFILPYAVFKPYKRTKDYFLISCIILMGILTISKSFLLALLTNLFFIVVGINYSIGYILLIVLLIILAFFNEFNFSIHGGLAHLYGLTSGLNLFITEGKIFGVGLGSAGNYSEGLLGVGGESGLGSLIVQLGVFGLLFIFFIYSILIALYKVYKLRKQWEYKASFVSLLSWFLIFLFSESSFGVTGNALIFVMVGMLLNSRANYSFKEG